MGKEERIKEEEKRIAKMFKTLPKDKLEMCGKLISRAAYMLISLEDMERQISDDGLVTSMSQGKYDIQRAHPLLIPYNTMIKNYTSIIKQLCESLPAQEAAVAGQALMMFATQHPKK